MAADTLKSTSITNLDSNPIVANTAGNGASAFRKDQEDFVTPTTGGLASTASTYKMVRIPVDAKVQEMYLRADGALDSNASPTLTLDVGAYWSDSTTDGTAVANQGVLISANAFAAALAFGATFSNVWALSGFGVANSQLPLWKVLSIGLSANGVSNAVSPGGFIDVVVAVHAVAATAVSKNLAISCSYVYG